MSTVPKITAVGKSQADNSYDILEVADNENIQKPGKVESSAADNKTEKFVPW